MENHSASKRYILFGYIYFFVYYYPRYCLPLIVILNKNFLFIYLKTALFYYRT